LGISTCWILGGEVRWDAMNIYWGCWTILGWPSLSLNQPSHVTIKHRIISRACLANSCNCGIFIWIEVKSDWCDITYKKVWNYFIKKWKKTNLFCSEFFYLNNNNKLLMWYKKWKKNAFYLTFLKKEKKKIKEWEWFAKHPLGIFSFRSTEIINF
jgi:hypothetical protein